MRRARDLVGARAVGGARYVAWYAMPEGEPIARALVSRARPRGMCDVPWYSLAGEELVAAVRDLDRDNDWYTTGADLVRWARRGRWGIIDGSAFDRAQIRAVLREWPADVRRWSTVFTARGLVLVMCGPRGRRMVVMCGSDTSLCVGRPFIEGALA